MKNLGELISYNRMLRCRIIWHAYKIYQNQLTIQNGHTSLYNLLKERFKLIPHEAYRLTRCVKLISLFPWILTYIKTGAHNQDSIAIFHKYINYFTGQDQLRELLEITSYRHLSQLKGTLNQVFKRGHSEQISIESDPTLMDQIKRAKCLLSNKSPKGVSNRMVLEEGLKRIIQDDHKKSDGKIHGNKRYISSALKAKVWERAQGRCEYRAPNGERCNSSWALEIDHIRPLAHGGASNFENLRLLCKAHNKYLAQIKLGKSFMDQYYSKQ